MRRPAASLALVSVLACFTPSAEPCCMVPADFKGSIHQTGQEAVLFYHQGREDLILKISYEISGARMPDRFAWVITVPQEPDAYAVAGTDLFSQVELWAFPLVHPPPPGGWAAVKAAAPVPAAAPLEFGRAVKVGPYDIQPVRALGREALEGLNAWLSSNGFPTEDPKHMEYFVDHKFTFLCIKVNPAPGEAAVSTAAGLVPLQLSFATPQPYYPLRFSSRQGVFDVTVYVLTKDHFNYRASGDSLARLNWADRGYLTNVPVTPASFPRGLSQAYGKGPFKEDAGRWHLNVLQATGVNRGQAIAGWKEDLFFATIPPPQIDTPLFVFAAAAAGLILLIAALEVRRRKRKSAAA